jgi:hypothetical protein
MWFRVRLVEPWPEVAPRKISTTTLRGKVIDDSTGCALSFCQTLVDGTSISAWSDTLGYFVLNGVPIGRVAIDAFRPAYLGRHLEIVAPNDSITLRLRRDPLLSSVGTGPCR